MSNVASDAPRPIRPKPEKTSIEVDGYANPAGARSDLREEQSFELPTRLFEQLPFAIYVCDRDGLVLRYNRRAAELWGRTPKLGDPNERFCGSLRMFRPDGSLLPHYLCPMADVLRTGVSVRQEEVHIERPDGSRGIALVDIEAIKDGDDTIVGAVNCFQDITESKHNEEAVLRLAAIVASSDDAIVSTDFDGIITSWNDGAERIFGYLTEETIGNSISILTPTNYQKEEETILERIRRGQRVEHYETIRQRKHGSLIEVSLTISPIKDARGKIIGMSKIVHDNTERKFKDKQIASLAHEVEHRAKNLLATVQAAVHLSQSDTVAGLKEVIEGRIKALANAHALFEHSNWTGADLRQLITDELSPYCQNGDERLSIEGQDLSLEPSVAQMIAIAIHELTTNAAKYGALSATDGRIGITWSRVLGDRLLLRWTETGGPSVKSPARRGFGTSVIERVVREQLKGEIRHQWRPEGLVCEVSLPL
jgi:two-component system CheB/CheR fusion protein